MYCLVPVNDVINKAILSWFLERKLRTNKLWPRLAEQMMRLCKMCIGVVLGKREVSDCSRFYLKVKLYFKFFFFKPLLKGCNIFIYIKIKKANIFKISI